MPRSLTKASNQVSLLANATINKGDCNRCWLKKTCTKKNPEEDTCGLVDQAVEEFHEFILRSPHYKEQDYLAARSIGALHGAIALCEAYFNQYGAIDFEEGQPMFNALFKDYLKVLKQYNDGLTQFGLNPKGRWELSGKRAQRTRTLDSSELADYIHKRAKDAEYQVGGKSKRPSRHNRVHKRSKADRVRRSSGDSRSYSPGNL